MNSSRPYGQSVARPANPAGPTIRAGLSVQELKAMTAMRVAQDHDPSTFGMKQSESAGVFRNPASSYQTATPQQLQAAGIQPLVRNDRSVGHLTREKSATLNSFPVYNSSSSFADQHLIGQNRPYNYDDLNAQQGQHNASPAAEVYRSNNSNNNSSSMYRSHGQQPQQALPVHRGGVPQINSVEDVKEMTRLRMLMSERESFFEGATNRPAETSLQGSYDSRYGQRYGESAGLGTLNSDSYDSHDFSVSSARDIRSSALGYPGGDSNQQQYHQQQRYHPTPVPSTSNKAMLHSASIGGSLRSAAGTIGHSPHPPQQHGYGISPYASRPSVPTHMHTHSTTSLPVGRSSSGVIGSRRIETAEPGAHHHYSQSLGTQSGYGAASTYQQQQQSIGSRPVDLDSFQLPPHREMGRTAGGGGIERELMLSRQLSGHPNRGLTGGIDRIERSLNGHQHGRLFDHEGLLGQDRFGSQLVGPSSSHRQQHSDLSTLNSLLSSPAVSPLERRDPLLDTLNRDSYIGGSVPTTARNHGSISPLLGPLSIATNQQFRSIEEPLPHNTIVAPLSLHQRTPSQKIVLDPIDLTATPRTATPRDVSPSPASSSLISQLAPLDVPTEKEKTRTPRQESEGPATTVRKLSFVPKAATFTTVEECRKTSSSPTSPTVLDKSPLSPTAQDTVGPAVSSPTYMQHPAAVGLSVRVDGIASPDDAPRTAQTLSPMNRKFPLMRAHSTSRIPTDSGTLSPKLLIIKSRLAGGESNTPPPAGLDRTMSDSSGGMNFLASEMAEMVLDTPMQAKYFAAHPHLWAEDNSREYSNMAPESLHSRENSSDLSRLLRDMNGMSACSSNSVSFHE